VNEHDFLSHLREEPRPEFADALYQRLTRLEPAAPAPEVSPSRGTAVRLRFRPVLVLAGGLALTASVAAAASPDFRDAVAGLFHSIGDQIYHEQDSPNVIGIGSPSGTPPTVPGASHTPLPQPPPGGGQPMAFDRAVDVHRSRGLEFPTWVPAGFDSEQAATANAGTEQGVSEFRWHDSAGRTLIFAVLVRPGGSDPGVFPVGPGALTEIDVAGAKGALIRGDWDDRGQWDETAGVRVRWTKGDAEYELSLNDASAAEAVVQMARSAAP
jgi:hypothetical protein